MKKYVKRVFALLMIITVMSAMVVPASAAEYYGNSYSTQDSRATSISHLL